MIIRHAISKSKLTDSEVARRAGLERANLCRLARGQHDAKMSTILRIIEACGLEFIEMRVRFAPNSTPEQKYKKPTLQA